jgi:hypothetical protein
MSEPKRYQIRAIADFLEVPAEKRSHCLQDFAAWLDVVSATREAFAAIPGIRVPTETFTWIDDGAHDMHLHAVVRMPRQQEPTP